MVAVSENPSYTLSNHLSPSLTATSSHSLSDDVSPRSRVFLEIINAAKIEEIDTLLSSSGVNPSPEVAEEVLQRMYDSPEKAIIFFRWAESSRPNLGPVWEVMVDLLGSNGLFEEMWDVVRAMREKLFLTKNTFFIIFRGYCGAGRVEEAVMAFYTIEAYGVSGDVAVVNALLGEIGRVSCETKKLFEFFDRVKGRIEPDLDTYTVLMEGCEKEGNVAKAKSVFDEVVGKFGWKKGSFRVYDAFLVTLFRGSQVDEAIRFIEVMKEEGCFPSLRFFSDSFGVLNTKKDLARTFSLWDMMVGNGILPNVGMFNSVIGLCCNSNKIDSAFRFLDEMVVYGAFPDSATYNTIFRCLVKNKKVREAGRFFTEMTKNECPPSHLNCAAAIALFFDGEDPEMGLEIWFYMVNNRIFPFEESANMLLIGLCNLGRLTELKRLAEKMLDRNIHISEATMAKIKQTFHKRGGDACGSYDSLSRKWKLSL